MPIVAFKLKSKIKAKSPRISKFTDNTANNFGIYAILKSLQFKFSGIRKRKSVVCSRKQTNSIVIDIALAVDKLRCIQNIIYSKSYHRNAKSAISVNIFGVSRIIILGNIGKIAGVHQSYLIAFNAH